MTPATKDLIKLTYDALSSVHDIPLFNQLYDNLREIEKRIAAESPKEPTPKEKARAAVEDYLALLHPIPTFSAALRAIVEALPE